MAGEPAGGRPRALVICADAAVCAVLSSRCGAGMDVSAVPDAQQAVELLRRGSRLDLVLADIESVKLRPQVLAELARYGDPIRVLMVDDPCRWANDKWSAAVWPAWDVQLVTARPPALGCVRILIRAARLREC